MKNLVKIAVVALLTLSVVQADEVSCIDRLTNGHNDSSTTSTLQLDNYEIRDYGNDHLAHAIKVIRLHLTELGCAKKDVNFGKGPTGRSHSRCSMLSRGAHNSRVCYVETNLGYFFVTVDFQDLATIIYSRWD